MKISFVKDKFIAYSQFEEREILSKKGFVWDSVLKRWVTTDARIAESLIQHCDQSAVYQIGWTKKGEVAKIAASAKTESSLALLHPPNVKPFPYQVAGVEYILKRNACLLGDEPGLGKAEFVENRVFTPTGRKRIGELVVGDFVIGSNGKPTRVLGVFPQGLKQLYRVEFNDHTSVLVCAEHLWRVDNRNINARGDRNPSHILSTDQLMNKNGRTTFRGTGYNSRKTYTVKTYLKDKSGNKWQIPIVKPIQFDASEKLPMDPYFLGLLLGDGCLRRHSITISSAEEEILESIRKSLPKGIELVKSSGYDYRISQSSMRSGGRPTPNVITDVVKRLGLYKASSHTKFIPDIYKYSSVENRIAILQGLMDTDGYVCKEPGAKHHNSTEYCSVSKQLAQDVAEIVHSLGGIARLSSKETSYKKNNERINCSIAYRLNIKLGSGMNPFRLKRKAEKYRTPEKYGVARYIKSIEPAFKGEAVCIKVEASDQLYVTENAIVTHNTCQALLTINMRPDARSVIVVCPSILKYNWLREARMWLVGEIVVYVYESKKIRYYKGRMTPHNKQTVLHIINYDILEKFMPRLMQAKADYVLFDESHYAKNFEARRTKLSMQLCRPSKYKLFITGTPIYNKPKDLFVALNAIDPVTFGDFPLFGQRYCNPKKIRVKGRTIVTYDGSSNLDELKLILRSNYMVRRMKKDVLKDLPDKLKDVIVLNEESLQAIVNKEKKLVGNFKAERDKLRQEMERIRTAGGDVQEEYKSRVKKLNEDRMRSIGEIAKVRHELALKKVPYVIEFVSELLNNSEDINSKLCLFAHHKDVIVALEKGLKKYKPVVITGETKDTDRQKFIHLFQNTDQSRIFIGSMAATGVGITLTASNTVVFAELDWTPAVVLQAEDRTHRIGQKNTVWVYHIVADGSLDSKIAKMLVEKDEVARKILDLDASKMFEKVIE